MPARRHIKLPAVPGTGDNVAAQITFRQWSARMRANAIQRVKDSVHVEQGHDSARHDEFATFANRYFVHAGNSKTTHDNGFLARTRKSRTQASALATASFVF